MSRPPLTNHRRDASACVPTMKGCLKLKSPIPSPSPSCPPQRKTVAFGEEVYEEVYLADVWDRTPAEPARKLTYQDLLELKEIQRSLPRAQQLPDLISGKPPSQYLDHVPIGLLPLLSEPTSPTSPTAPSPPPPSPAAWGFPPPPTTPKRWPPPPSTSWVPAHMQHLLPKRPPPEPKHPTFSFLPLLDTPAPSPYSSQPPSRSPSPEHHSDTTPSLTSSPVSSSRASSSSPEPAFLSLDDDDDGDRGRAHGHACTYTPPPTTAWHAFPDHARTRTPRRADTERSAPAPTHRRKNVMILNGIEISLDEDDAEDDVAPTPRPAPPPPRCAMSVQNGLGYADVASPWAG